jgi:nucleotide-binding universal stress UspA family protein
MPLYFSGFVFSLTVYYIWIAVAMTWAVVAAAVIILLPLISLSLNALGPRTLHLNANRDDEFSFQHNDHIHNEEFKKVLVAIDGSIQSLRALNYANNIFSGVCVCGAKYYRAKIFVLNVIEWADDEEDYIDNELAAKMQEEGRLMLRSFMVNNKMLDCERMIKLGDPAIKISEVASSLDADMIIMGKKGLGNTESEIGHVSNKLLKLTSKPVLFLK